MGKDSFYIFFLKKKLPHIYLTFYSVLFMWRFQADIFTIKSYLYFQ
ncbi:hypothetical protein GGQ94_003063 [Petrimonas sulfuriphila]|jgi:hypothetical protein